MATKKSDSTKKEKTAASKYKRKPRRLKKNTAEL